MKKIIKKVLDELGKEKPDLSYIKGLLEAASEEEELRFIPAEKPSSEVPPNPNIPKPTNLPPVDTPNPGMEALSGKFKGHG